MTCTNTYYPGKDHYAADRAEALRLLRIYPPLAAMARENRAFLARAMPPGQDMAFSAAAKAAP